MYNKPKITGIVVEFGSELNITDSVTTIDYVDRGTWRDLEFMGVPGGGYSRIIDSLTAPLASQIYLNTQVTQIEYDPNYLIRVTSVNTQTGQEQIHHTQTAIVTVPLGVLQNNDIEFVPPLPIEKQTAIHTIGFGTLNKGVMYWDQNTEDVSWFPTEIDLQLITELDADSEEWTYFFNDHSQDGNDDNFVLTSWIGGTAAELWDGKPDEDIIAVVMTNLRKMFPSTNVPDPTNYIISHWKSDEYARGSYSFDRADVDSSSARKDLAEPMGGNRIYFAGEATDDTWWGTAVGAYDTGSSSASDLIKSDILQDIIILPKPPARNTTGDAIDCVAFQLPCDSDEDCCGVNSECKLRIFSPDLAMSVCTLKPGCAAGRERIDNGGRTRGGAASRARGCP